MSNNETIPNHPVTLRSSPEARHQPRAAREPSPAGPPPGGVSSLTGIVNPGLTAPGA